MVFDIRWLPVLIINFFVIFIVQMTNDALSPLSIYFYLGSLLIVFPVYHLDKIGGFFCVAMSALALDASHLINFGSSLLPFLIIYFIAYETKDRIHQNSKIHIIALNIFLNTILIIILSFILGGDALSSLSYWLKISVDIFFSAIAICAFSPLVQILQKNALLFFGFEAETEKKIM
jgi:hypothetical protein